MPIALLDHAISIILIILIRLIRPLLGKASCRFSVGCTQYGVTQLETHPLPTALWLIVTRLASCNVFNRFNSSDQQ